MRGSIAPTYLRRYFALALLHTTRRHRRHNERFTIAITAKAGCKIHPCPHIQSNVMFTLNTIIIVPQLNRPQISSFGHLVRDHDNLTTSLSHSSQLPPLNCVIRVFSQYPHSLPHPIIRGPITPQDAIPTETAVPRKPSALHNLGKQM